MTDRKGAKRRELLDDLLVRRTIEPLGETETESLGELLGSYPTVDGDAFERAAAAVWLAAARGTRDEMPAVLRRRIMAKIDPAQRPGQPETDADPEI